MCLLIALARTHRAYPLVVAANRDELLTRPATAMTVLSHEAPRILGGRDGVAGGTWLATNRHGVVAGLTNLPSRTVPDPARRSRGELPVRLAQHRTAREAADAFAAEVDPTLYNPAWLLVGDAHSLHFIDITGARVEVRTLEAGLHVLENKPLDAPSVKAAHVRRQVAPALHLEGPALVTHLARVLADHTVPPGAEDDDSPRPPEAHAACVHAGPYGTRSASIILVAGTVAPPEVRVADGPPCVTPFDGVELWRSEP